MRKNLVLVLVVGLLFVASVGVARLVIDRGDPVALANAEPLAPADDGEFVCRLAATEGTLALHPLTGLGLENRAGSVDAIVWPNGWRASTATDGRVTLRDDKDQVVAHTGDYIRGGGGQAHYEGTTDAFSICPFSIEVGEAPAK